MKVEETKTSVAINFTCDELKTIKKYLKYQIKRHNKIKPNCFGEIVCKNLLKEI